MVGAEGKLCGSQGRLDRSPTVATFTVRVGACAQACRSQQNALLECLVVVLFQSPVLSIPPAVGNWRAHNPSRVHSLLGVRAFDDYDIEHGKGDERALEIGLTDDIGPYL